MEDTVSDDERNDDEDVSGMPVCLFCVTYVCQSECRGIVQGYAFSQLKFLQLWLIVWDNQKHRCHYVCVKYRICLWIMNRVLCKL